MHFFIETIYQNVNVNCTILIQGFKVFKLKVKGFKSNIEKITKIERRVQVFKCTVSRTKRKKPSIFTMRYISNKISKRFLNKNKCPSILYDFVRMKRNETTHFYTTLAEFKSTLSTTPDQPILNSARSPKRPPVDQTTQKRQKQAATILHRVSAYERRRCRKRMKPSEGAHGRYKNGNKILSLSLSFSLSLFLSRG